jgi:hypothetical protein
MLNRFGFVVGFFLLFSAVEAFSPPAHYLSIYHSLTHNNYMFTLDDGGYLSVVLPPQYDRGEQRPFLAEPFKTFRVLKLRSVIIPKIYDLVALNRIIPEGIYPYMVGPLRIVVKRPRRDDSYMQNLRKKAQVLREMGKLVQSFEDVLDLEFKGRTFERLRGRTLVTWLLRKGIAVVNRPFFKEDPGLLRHYLKLEAGARASKRGLWSRYHLPRFLPPFLPTTAQ